MFSRRWVEHIDGKTSHFFICDIPNSPIILVCEHRHEKTFIDSSTIDRMFYKQFALLLPFNDKHYVVLANENASNGVFIATVNTNVQ